MNFRNMIAVAAVSVSVLAIGQVNAETISYDVTGTFSDFPNSVAHNFTADFTLTVSGGQATSGTGTITGIGYNPSQAFSLTLLTANSPGVEINGSNQQLYKSNDGTHWVGWNTSTTVAFDGADSGPWQLRFDGVGAIRTKPARRRLPLAV